MDAGQRDGDSAPSARAVADAGHHLSGRTWTPFPGSIFSQRAAPINAIPPAVANETGQPHCAAIQGVRLGETAPPRLAPVFMRPDKSPAWVLEESVVDAQ